jgi:hypothetical protein
MKKSILMVSSILVASVLFTGCGIKTPEYSVSADNVQTLRNYKDVKVSVGSFTAKTPGESQVLCRLAETITTPKGEPFEEYIQSALISELKMSDIYDEKSNLKISGNLKKIYGSSMIGAAYWEIELEVSSSNGKSINVYTKREYPSAFIAYTACSNMATSFSPTIRELINQVINHKDFSTLLLK